MAADFASRCRWPCAPCSSSRIRRRAAIGQTWREGLTLPPMNLGERVRLLLPAALRDKLAEVEATLGRLVEFRVDAALDGLAAGKASSDGTIHLSSLTAAEVLAATAELSRDTSGVLGEEIMHLVRRAERYPAIQPQGLASLHDYDLALSCLSGHFEEHAFFPFLENLGLDPRGVLTATIDQSGRMLPRMLPHIEQNGHTAKWRVRLSTLFVQTSLLAPESLARTRLLGLFHDPVLVPYAQLGEFLNGEITAAAGSAPLEVGERMRRCVERLDLPREAAVVTVPAFPS